jgi:hypothetical protein
MVEKGPCRWTVKQFYAWWNSMRTRFGKLTKGGKSGDGAKKLLDRDK